MHNPRIYSLTHHPNPLHWHAVLDNRIKHQRYCQSAHIPGWHDVYAVIASFPPHLTTKSLWRDTWHSLRGANVVYSLSAPSVKFKFALQSRVEKKYYTEKLPQWREFTTWHPHTCYDFIESETETELNPSYPSEKAVGVVFSLPL